MATASSPFDAALHRVQADVAKRYGWIDSVHGSLRVGRVGNISPGANGVERERGRQVHNDLECLGGGDLICGKSESDLYAGDCHGRVALSGSFYLVHCVLCGVRAGKRKRSDQVRLLSGRSKFDALRRLVLRGVSCDRRFSALLLSPAAARAPSLWLAYNAMVYRNPLEFANGPYSAKAIERKTATVNPANGNLVAAASYFLKAAELNVSQSNWQGRLWLALALLGSAVTLYNRRGLIALFLWVPLPFYALSIAYGSVPIFVPTWWPFARYNLRYGLQLLPAFAVFVPQGISFLVQRVTDLNRIRAAARPFATTVTVLAILLFAASSYAAIWRVDPICYQEADLNMKGRLALDRQLGEWIKSLPPNSTLLMYLGEHVGALERAGIPLKRTINEGNHRVWKQPSDPEGLWERALANPAEYADYAIGFQGDPVWDAARNRKLTALVEIHTTGQSSAAIFQGRAAANPRNSPQ